MTDVTEVIENLREGVIENLRQGVRGEIVFRDALKMIYGSCQHHIHSIAIRLLNKLHFFLDFHPDNFAICIHILAKFHNSAYPIVHSALRVLN